MNCQPASMYFISIKFIPFTILKWKLLNFYSSLQQSRIIARISSFFLSLTKSG